MALPSCLASGVDHFRANSSSCSSSWGCFRSCAGADEKVRREAEVKTGSLVRVRDLGLRLMRVDASFDAGFDDGLDVDVGLFSARNTAGLMLHNSTIAQAEVMHALSETERRGGWRFIFCRVADAGRGRIGVLHSTVAVGIS